MSGECRKIEDEDKFYLRRGVRRRPNIGECKTPFVRASKSTWKQTGLPGARFPLGPDGRGLEAPGRGSLAERPEAGADSPTALVSESRFVRCPVAEREAVPQVGREPADKET
jgi:hypothetical protein